jgi:inner membrane protein
MDPISQGVLGASWAQARTGRERLPVAGLLGAVAGLAPDLDTLIQSANDPLLFLEYHRQFTHSLAFAPVGALVCTLLLYQAVRARLRFGEAYLSCLLGFASHGLLDACTSYGTELLWPFSDTRVAWSIIAVVDPGFTLPILVLVMLAAYRKRIRYAQLAVVWAAVYLALAVVQHGRAEAAGGAIAAERGHRPVRLEVKPAFASLLLWKIIYEFDGRYYVDAVRTGFALTRYPGASISKLDIRRDFPWLDPGSRQAADVERFRHISDDFLAVDPAEPARIVDMRYSMVPNEISAFWAIVLDQRTPPDEHVGFVTTRQAAPEQARRLFDMLF